MTPSPAASRRIHVVALGATVAIDVPDDRLLAPLLHAWEACLADAVSDCPVVQAPMLPGGDGVDEPVPPSVLSGLTQQVTYAAIKARAGELLMFHAGGLSNLDTGATIAFVAPGGTGKTTLVRTLGPGRGYVSDETIGVGIGVDRVIQPYCKPLSVRRAEPGAPKDELSPLELGLSVPHAQPWLAGMVVLRRDLQAGEAVRIQEVDNLDALVMLGPETSSLAAMDRPLHVLAGLLDAVGGLRVVHYHDAVDLEPIVRSVSERQR